LIFCILFIDIDELFTSEVYLIFRIIGIIYHFLNIIFFLSFRLLLLLDLIIIKYNFLVFFHRISQQRNINYGDTYDVDEDKIAIGSFWGWNKRDVG
jgi:hypothetical protein